ncbi:MAG TPA: hypothetical protein VF491_10405 [Vicinamibacterales bacterium]|jgi:hypothetical protein
MTLEDIARKLDTIDTRLSTLVRRVDDGFTASESALRLGLTALESKIDDSSRASQIRDEELHRLTRFGLEATEVIADSINRRLDESNRKDDEQITLIKDVIRQQLTRP